MSKSQMQAIERKQIKNIQQQHHQLLNKCLFYAEELGNQFSEKQLFEDFQRYVDVRIDVLDYDGLVDLKKKIIDNYHELMDIEHDLHFQYSREKSKKSYFKPIQFQSNEVSAKVTKVDKNQHKNMKKNHNLQKRETLPVYTIRTDSMMNKIDSINSFVLSLKSSMKKQAESPQRLEQDDYLMCQPEFIKLRQQFQRCRMAQEDMLSSFNQRIQQQSTKVIQNSPILQQTQQYKIIKVFHEYKKIGNPQQQLNNRKKQEIEKGNMILQQLEEEMQMNQQNNIQDLKRKVQNDFQKMLVQIQQDIKRERENAKGTKRKKVMMKEVGVETMAKTRNVKYEISMNRPKQADFNFKL